MGPDELITKKDLEPISRQLDFILKELSRLNKQENEKPITITEAQKILGCGYDRIKTLIKRKLLMETADGKITRGSIDQYLKP